MRLSSVCSSFSSTVLRISSSFLALSSWREESLFSTVVRMPESCSPLWVVKLWNRASTLRMSSATVFCRLSCRIPSSRVICCLLLASACPSALTERVMFCALSCRDWRDSSMSTPRSRSSSSRMGPSPSSLRRDFAAMTAATIAAAHAPAAKSAAAHNKTWSMISPFTGRSRSGQKMRPPPAGRRKRCSNQRIL